MHETSQSASPALAPGSLVLHAEARILREVEGWPGVHLETGNFGAIAVMVGARELGHLHGDWAAHFAFPRGVWLELMRAGRVRCHPVFPRQEGLAAREIETEEDVREIVALLRLNYERASASAPPS